MADDNTARNVDLKEERYEQFVKRCAKETLFQIAPCVPKTQKRERRCTQLRRKSHRLIAVLTLLALLLPAVPVAAAPTAPDIKGHWAEAAIQQLVDLGAVSGLPDGTFRPDLTVTRAEFVTMVNKSLRITPVTGTSRFKDVKPEDWFAGQVEAAAAYGYVAGNPDGTLAPPIVPSPVNKRQLC